MVCHIRIFGHEANIRVQNECRKDDPSSFARTFIAAMRALGMSDYVIACELENQAAAIGGPDFAQ